MYAKCPICPEPTNVEYQYSESTCAYYPPIYNEEGKNINPDRNGSTHYHKCLSCGTDFTSKS